MTDLADAPALENLTQRDRRRFGQDGAVATAAATHKHIHSAFERWAQRTPDAIAVAHRTERVTYAEFDRRANCLASLLRVHGVRAGDRVGLFLHRCVPMVLGILATLKIGAAYVPQDAGSTPHQRLGDVMACARTRVVLTTAEHAARIPRAKGRVVIALDELALEALTYDGSIPLVTAADHDTGTAAVIFNSATGRPRGVEVTHANLCEVLLTEPDPLTGQPGRCVTALVDNPCHSDVWEIFAALSHGETLVIGARGIEDMRRDTTR